MSGEPNNTEARGDPSLRIVQRGHGRMTRTRHNVDLSDITVNTNGL